MATAQIVLAVLFGIHWIAFAVLFVRSRRPSLLLPLAVFTLLVAVQFLANSPVVVDLGPLEPCPLPDLLRSTALALAVPSIGMMVVRIVQRRRAEAAATH